MRWNKESTFRTKPCGRPSIVFNSPAMCCASVSPSQNRQSVDRALHGSTSPTNYSDLILSGDVSYEADVWGSVRHSVASSRALAQASAADLETIRLSLHAELAL